MKKGNHRGTETQRRKRVNQFLVFSESLCLCGCLSPSRAMTMQLGMIGLGRMGGNMVLRLLRAGHTCVAYDRDQERTRTFDQDEKKHSDKAGSVADLVKMLTPPRAVWVMLPAGAVTEGAIKELAGLLQPGDTVIDGGNTFFKDDVRRAGELAPKGITYLDVGTSGGVWGLERGYC